MANAEPTAEDLKAGRRLAGDCAWKEYGQIDCIESKCVPCLRADAIAQHTAAVREAAHRAGRREMREEAAHCVENSIGYGVVTIAAKVRGLSDTPPRAPSGREES